MLKSTDLDCAVMSFQMHMVSAAEFVVQDAAINLISASLKSIRRTTL